MKTYSWFVPPAPPADDPARLHPARWSSGNRVVRDMVGAYPGVLVLHILSYLIGSGIAAFVPVVVGMIVDGLVGEEKFNAWWLFAVLVGIFILQFIGEATGDGLAAASVRRVTHNAQQHLSSGVLRRGAGAMSPGTVLNTIDADANTVGRYRELLSFPLMAIGYAAGAVGAGAEDLPPEVEQQLALARVALSGPKVLILDEATAEAGSDATNALEDAAARITADTTALVVAHRLDQAAAADRILVMDAGRIIEDGTHAELLAVDGRYAQLFAAWSGGGH